MVLYTTASFQWQEIWIETTSHHLALQIGTMVFVIVSRTKIVVLCVVVSFPFVLFVFGHPQYHNLA